METFANRTQIKNESKLFDMALKSCQYEYLIDGSVSPWCKFFDHQMLKTITYREDIKYNCKYGYKHEISKLMTCDLVNHLIKSLEKFVKE